LTLLIFFCGWSRPVLAGAARSGSGLAVGHPEGLALTLVRTALADEGVGTNEIVHRVGASKPTVIAWKKRYATDSPTMAKYR
jgi:hypothetical protein